MKTIEHYDFNGNKFVFKFTDGTWGRQCRCCGYIQSYSVRGDARYRDKCSRGCFKCSKHQYLEDDVRPKLNAADIKNKAKEVFDKHDLQKYGRIFD